MWGQKTCVRCQGTNCCSIGTAAGPEWRNMRDIVPVCHQHLFVSSWPNRLNWQRVQWRHVVTSLWAPLPNFLGVNLFSQNSMILQICSWPCALLFQREFLLHLLVLTNVNCQLSRCTENVMENFVESMDSSNESCFGWEGFLARLSLKRHLVDLWAANQRAFVPIGKRVRCWFQDSLLLFSSYHRWKLESEVALGGWSLFCVR